MESKAVDLHTFSERENGSVLEEPLEGRSLSKLNLCEHDPGRRTRPWGCRGRMGSVAVLKYSVVGLYLLVLLILVGIFILAVSRPQASPEELKALLGDVQRLNETFRDLQLLQCPPPQGDLLEHIWRLQDLLQNHSDSLLLLSGSLQRLQGLLWALQSQAGQTDSSLWRLRDSLGQQSDAAQLELSRLSVEANGSRLLLEHHQHLLGHLGAAGGAGRAGGGAGRGGGVHEPQLLLRAPPAVLPAPRPAGAAGQRQRRRAQDAGGARRHGEAAEAGAGPAQQHHRGAAHEGLGALRGAEEHLRDPGATGTQRRPRHGGDGGRARPARPSRAPRHSRRAGPARPARTQGGPGRAGPARPHGNARLQRRARPQGGQRGQGGPRSRRWHRSVRGLGAAGERLRGARGAPGDFPRAALGLGVRRRLGRAGRGRGVPHAGLPRRRRRLPHGALRTRHGEDLDGRRVLHGHRGVPGALRLLGLGPHQLRPRRGRWRALPDRLTPKSIPKRSDPKIHPITE
uniref:Uncharacterized protein n=1 Tax=Geospiza parvula TaxID=87175 RepID=A0A8C3MRB3_GEOPR